MKAREVSVLVSTSDGRVLLDRVFRVSTQAGRKALCSEMVTFAELAAGGGYVRIEFGEVRK